MRITTSLLLLLVAGVCHADGITGQEVLDGLGVPQKDRRELEEGRVLAYDGEDYEGSNRELAADAIVLIDKSLDDVVEQIGEVGSIIPTKYLIEYHDIESIDDFAEVGFTIDEIEEADKLLGARRGKSLNLSDAELAMLSRAKSRGSKLDAAGRVELASDALRDILIARYRAYRDGGLRNIGEYRRSKRKAIDIGAELTTTTETFAPFEPDFPEYYRVMHDYPEGADCCEHVFRWMKVKLRDRPAFALTHTFWLRAADFVLITERHYYVTHTINSVQVTVSWLPYDEDTYMGLAVSASTDILESMMGRMLRPLGRNKARDMVSDVLSDFREELRESDAGAAPE